MTCTHLLKPFYQKRFYIFKHKYNKLKYKFECIVCNSPDNLYVCLDCNIVCCENDRCRAHNIFIDFKYNSRLICVNNSCNSSLDDVNGSILYPQIFTTINITCKGLPNLGNTCFINALIQALFSLTPFTRFLLVSKTCQDEYCLKCTIRHFFVKYHTTQNKFINLFINTISRHSAEFSGKEQQDVYLFYLFLINTKCTKNISYIKTGQDEHKTVNHKLQKYTGVSIPFLIKGYNILQCSACKNIKAKHKDCLVSLSLDFSSSLSQSLKLYSSKESLTDLIFCHRCKKNTNFLKFFKIQKINKILVLHIKRFKTVNYVSSKINEDILVDEELIIRSKRFVLKGFIVHSGSLNFGHYIAYINKDGVWYCVDDEKVNIVNFKDVVKKAYLLFFIKKL